MEADESGFAVAFGGLLRLDDLADAEVGAADRGSGACRAHEAVQRRIVSSKQCPLSRKASMMRRACASSTELKSLIPKVIAPRQTGDTLRPDRPIVT